MRHSRLILLLCSVLPFASVYAQSPSSNYILVREMLDSAGTDSRVRLQYYDGIGRPTQQVESQGGGAYSATLTEYDIAGRPVREWLPTPVGSALDQIPVPSLAYKARDFYGDSRPFRVTSYDALDRRTTVLGAGEAWARGGHAARVEYTGNGENEALRFDAPLNDTTVVSAGYYEAGSLRVEIATDEDGREIRTYTDLFGNKVLERRAGNVDTHFVYDSMNRLRFVLTPAYTSEQDVTLNAYEYRYDRRRRCVWKRLPGCAPQRFGYDNANRMVFSQDGVQRASGSATFYLYDIFGRLAVKGICEAPQKMSVDGVATVEYTGTGALMGYECALMSLSDSLRVSEIIEADYYSDYRFLSYGGYKGMGSLDFTPKPGYASKPGCGRSLLTGKCLRNLTDGTLTLSAVYYDADGNAVLSRCATEDGTADDTFTAYTFSGSPSRRLHEHRRARSATSLSEEYFYTYQPSTGRPLRTEYSLNGSPRTCLAENAYDGVGRLVSVTVPSVGTTSYGYNVRSWLMSISSNVFRESLVYTGGLHPQYFGNPSAMSWKTYGNPGARHYDYAYDNLDRLVSATYDDGSTKTVNNHYGTSYEYDVMGNVTRLDRRGLLAAGEYGYIDRLRYKYVGNHVVRIDDAVEDGPTYKDAFHFVDGADNDDEYTYDANGNMTKDLNKGITGIEYNCLNLPQRIHFNSPIQNKTITYGYNADGTKTSATYTTSLQRIPWSKNVLASGTGKTVIPVDSVSVGDRPVLHPDFVLASNRTDYCGNIIYECDTLKRVLIDGGYITFAGTKSGILFSPLYHYYVKDHLGNNRVVVNGDGKVEETNSYYPYGGLMADNTNIKSVQPYKYIGKEFDGMYGWNMLDHGARWYDAASIVWRNMDMLAENNYSLSPYVSCDDNPVSNIDGDGKIVVPYISVDYANGSWTESMYNSPPNFLQAMLAFARTDFGRKLLADFTPKGSKIYGIQGNGKYADFKLTLYEKRIEAEKICLCEFVCVRC